jgi:hypothetical protein
MRGGFIFLLCYVGMVLAAIIFLFGCAPPVENKRAEIIMKRYPVAGNGLYEVVTDKAICYVYAGGGVFCNFKLENK